MSGSNLPNSTAVTEKVLQPKKEWQLYSSLCGAIEGFSQSAFDLGVHLSTWAPAAICAKAPKIAEAERQVRRVQPYLSWLSADGADVVDGEGLNTSITLLYAIAQGPAPVPIMSVGNDGKSALYMRNSDVSLEMLVSGSSVEYFVSGSKMDEDIFDEEEVKEGQIPQGLLGIIYANFAGNAAG